MADLDNFDAGQVEPSRSFDLLPKGWVEAVIVESSSKETNDNGVEKKRVTMVYQFTDPRPIFKGRKLWHGLNLKNPSAMAVQISKGQLSSICRAVGIPKPKDSSELHNLPHMVLIGQRTNKQTGELENVINDWKPKGGSPAAALAPTGTDGGAPAASPVSAPAGGGSAPWDHPTT